MNLTQKIRIFPSKEQEHVLWTLSEKCRLVYNFALAKRIENWQQNNNKSKEERHYIGYLDQSRTLPSLKEKYPEYKWVYSKVLQTQLKQLDSNYKSFFTLWKKGDKDARPPRFRGKKYFTTYVIINQGSNYKRIQLYSLIDILRKQFLSLNFPPISFQKVGLSK